LSLLPLKIAGTPSEEASRFDRAGQAVGDAMEYSAIRTQPALPAERLA